MAQIEAYPHFGAAAGRGQELRPVRERVDQRQADPQPVAVGIRLLKPAAPVPDRHLELPELDVDDDRDRAGLAAVGVVRGVVAGLADDRLEVAQQLRPERERRRDAAEDGAYQPGGVGPAAQAQVEHTGSPADHVRWIPHSGPAKTVRRNAE